MLVNSTNTPLQASDFPVVTLCNVNMRSRARARKKANVTISTYQDLKEVQFFFLGRWGTAM